MRCFCVVFFHLKTDHPFRHAKKHLPTLRNGLFSKRERRRSNERGTLHKGKDMLEERGLQEEI